MILGLIDEGTTPSDTIIDYNKVSSFQINLSSRFENKLLPHDLIIVRNHGYDDKDVGGGVWRRGGPARVAKPSWRPNPSRVWVCFGVQEQPAPKSTPMLHTESVLDSLYMDGKIISRSFQWH